jgi:hypothetical protein
MSPRREFHDDNPTRETCLRGNSATLCHLSFIHVHALFGRSSRIHGWFNQGLIIQAERVPHSFGRGHTVWLCTESPPKNGQGYHAVRRAGLMMDLLLASPSMDLKYGCNFNRFIWQHTPPSYLRYQVVSTSETSKP